MLVSFPHFNTGFCVLTNCLRAWSTRVGGVGFLHGAAAVQLVLGVVAVWR